MSQSSVTEQVRDLQAAGFPVRRGVRIMDAPKTDDPRKIGTQIWLSRWARNVFRNFPIVSKAFGARFLHDACHGMPCFVVGVGPSLDKSIEELKAVKGRGVIVATDAALRALLANGITPDLVVSYDCQENQKQLWESVLAAPTCLFNSCTHPDSIASYPGPVLFFNQYHTQDELCKTILPGVLPEIGQIPSGGTVGTMACFVGGLMGCDPVCVVGMDFCYQESETPGAWRYRAQDYRWEKNKGAGVPDAWAKTEIKELYDNDERIGRSFMVKRDDGEYRSDPELAFYLESFIDLMPQFKIPVVNCTPAGMIPKLKTDLQGATLPGGFASMTLSEAVGKYCTKEFQAGRSILPHLASIIPDPRKKV